MVTIYDAQTQTSFQLDISECNTADDIKQLIYQKNGVEVKYQNLSYDGKPLNNNIKDIHWSASKKIMLKIQSRKIKFTVLLGQNKIPCELSQHFPIIKVKAKVADLNNDPSYKPINMELYYNNTLLNDNSKLQDYNIKDGDQLVFQEGRTGVAISLMIHVKIFSNKRFICESDFKSISSIDTVITTCCNKIGTDQSYANVYYHDQLLKRTTLLQELEPSPDGYVFELSYSINVKIYNKYESVHFFVNDTIQDVLDKIHSTFHIEDNIDFTSDTQVRDPTSILSKLLKKPDIDFQIRCIPHNTHVISIAYNDGQNQLHCNITTVDNDLIDTVIQRAIEMMNLPKNYAYELIYDGKVVDNYRTVREENFSNATRVALHQKDKLEEAPEQPQEIAPVDSQYYAKEFDKCYETIIQSPGSMLDQLSIIIKLIKEDQNRTISPDKLLYLYNRINDKLKSYPLHVTEFQTSSLFINTLLNYRNYHNTVFCKLNIVSYCHHFEQQDIQYNTDILSLMFAIIEDYFTPRDNQEKRSLVEKSSSDYSYINGLLSSLISIHQANPTVIRKLLKPLSLISNLCPDVTYAPDIINVISRICQLNGNESIVDTSMRSSFAFMVNKLILLYYKQKRVNEIAWCLTNYKDERNCYESFIKVLERVIRDSTMMKALLTPALNYLLHVMTFEESFNKVATKRILILLRSFSKTQDCAQIYLQDHRLSILFNLINKNTDDQSVIEDTLELLEILVYYNSLISDICVYGKSFFNQVFQIPSLTTKLLSMFVTMSSKDNGIAIVNNDLMSNIYTYQFSEDPIQREREITSIMKLYNSLLPQVNDISVEDIQTSTQLEFISLALSQRTEPLDRMGFENFFTFVENVANSDASKIQILVDSNVFKSFLDMLNANQKIFQDDKYIPLLILLLRKSINSVGGVLCHHELMDCLYSELKSCKDMTRCTKIMDLMVELAINSHFKTIFLEKNMNGNFYTIENHALSSNNDIKGKLYNFIVNLSTSEDLSIVFRTVMLYPEFIINKMLLYQAISMKCSDLLNISKEKLMENPDFAKFREFLQTSKKEATQREDSQNIKKFLDYTSTSCCTIL